MSDLDDDSPLSSLDSDTPKQSLPEAAEEAETGARALAPHAAPLAFEDSEDLATDLDDAAGEVPILSPSATNYAPCPGMLIQLAAVPATTTKDSLISRKHNGWNV